MHASSAARWKPVIGLLFVIIEPFSQDLTVKTLYVEIGPSRRLSKGEWVTFSANVRWKGTSHANRCRCSFMLYQNVGSNVFGLSQSTRMSGRRTDRHNYENYCYYYCCCCCCLIFIRTRSTYNKVLTFTTT